MRKVLVSVLCASISLGASSFAIAGSRGEAIQPEEGPAPVPVAPAAIEEESRPPGYWYIGAGALFSIENFHCDADNAWGYNVRAGRRINDYVAVEGMFEHPVSDFDDADIVDGQNPPQPFGDIEVWNVTANGRFYPITGRFQPFALIGAGYGQANLPQDDNGGFIARFGIGIDVLITDNFGVTTGVDYVLGTGALSNYDQIPINLGIFFNFI